MQFIQYKNRPAIDKPQANWLIVVKFLRGERI